MTAAAEGPAWTEANSGRYAGRFPLAVERHALRQVGRLMPGITSVTNHARYYTLHALVAAEADARDLPAEEARQLLRRAEVVLAGITLAHGSHAGYGAPHGGGAVERELRSGLLDVAGLAADKVYSIQHWGFTGTYFGSEYELGMVVWGKAGPRPGPSLSVDAVRGGLGDILDLARQDVVSAAELGAASHLCLCQAASGADGVHLRTRLLPPIEDIRAHHREDRRNQSLRLLLRLYELVGAEVASPDLVFTRRLPFDAEFADDPVVTSFDAYPRGWG